MVIFILYIFEYKYTNTPDTFVQEARQILFSVNFSFLIVLLSVDVGMKLVKPREIMLSYLGFYFLFV